MHVKVCLGELHPTPVWDAAVGPSVIPESEPLRLSRFWFPSNYEESYPSSETIVSQEFIWFITTWEGIGTVLSKNPF